jgi:single-strand DNA-binding protein
MSNLNSILVEGDVIGDPKFNINSEGVFICCKFTISSCRYFKTDTGLEKEVSYFDIETWYKLAEQCAKRGHKGRGVRVVGRLKQERWNDIDGKPQSKIIIVAEHVEFKPGFEHEEPEEFTNYENETGEENLEMKY